MTYNGFLNIEVGHFYKLQYNGSKVLAYCASEDTFIIKAGSVIDMEPWPSCLEPNHKEPSWGGVADDFAVCECVYKKKNIDYLAYFSKDYDKATPLEVAQIATGREDADPAALWVDVFGE